MPAPPPLPQAAVKHLLPEIKPQDASKLCVVIDLDETLVHSSFKVGDSPTPPRLLCPPPRDAWHLGTHVQHLAQPCWGGGVSLGGGSRRCVVGRGPSAFGQGVPARR